MNKAFSIITLVAGLSVFAFACSLSGEHKSAPVRQGTTFVTPIRLDADAGVSVLPEVPNAPCQVRKVPTAKKVAKKPVVQLDRTVFCRSIDLANGRVGEKVLACEYIAS